MMKKNNNINYQTIYSTQLYLSSNDANIYLNGSKKSSVTFFFEDLLKLDKSSIEMRVSLVNAQIPVSYYQINSTNNTIYINTIPYVFPDGNYNVNSFINTWYNIVGNNWSVTFNSINNTFLFSYPSSSFIFYDDIQNSIFPVIGFNIGKTYTSVNNQINGLYPANFLGLNRINIKSSTFNFRNLDTYEKGRTTTISSIPVNASSNGLINYINITNYKSIFKNHEISSLNIDITDDNSNFIDFHNINWSMTLQIDIVNEVINNLDDLNDVYENAKQEL